MNDMRTQTLYFPEAMLADIQTEALRLDTSLSWIVQQAWDIAGTRIEQDLDEAAAFGGEKRMQSIFFPEEMLAMIQSEAQRLDRSLSWVVQRAYRHARAEILALTPSRPESS